MDVLAESTAVAVVNVPIEKINLTESLFTLKDDQYQACSTAHIAGGSSFSKDGKRMSLNVEQVGDSLLVQHHVEDINKKDHCRVNSHSDSISQAGNTKLGITWELKVKKLSDTSCELSNHVVVLIQAIYPYFAQLAGYRSRPGTGKADMQPAMIGKSIIRLIMRCMFLTWPSKSKFLLNHIVPMRN